MPLQAIWQPNWEWYSGHPIRKPQVEILQPSHAYPHYFISSRPHFAAGRMDTSHLRSVSSQKWSSIRFAPMKTNIVSASKPLRPLLHFRTATPR